MKNSISASPPKKTISHATCCKLAGDRQLQVLKHQSAGIDAQQRQLAADIEEQSQQLNSMKQKLELLVSEDTAAAGGEFARGEFAHADSIRNEEIEIALLREKERRAKS
jgi:hypothetical protein